MAKDKKKAKKDKKANKTVKPSKAKKVVKATKPVAKPIVVKAVPVPTSKPFEQEKASLIENPEEVKEIVEHDPLWETIEKVSFMGMCDILHAMSDGFLRRDTKPNERFQAAWRAVLAIAGWPEEEFWTAYELDNPCPECGGDLSDEDEEELPKLKPAIDPMAN